jgi:hypothetical protein
LFFASQSIGYAAVEFQPEKLQPLTAALGATPAPPKGNGRGILEVVQLYNNAVKQATFGKPGSPSGNSFYVAYNNEQNTVYIPTAAGQTYVVDRIANKTINHFATIKGGRVARLTPDKSILLVLSGKQLAGYYTLTSKQVFKTPIGGNAMVIDPNGSYVYVGGNMDKQITEVQLPTGKISHTFHVAGSGDLAWADSKIFSADMKTGIMSVLNPTTGKVARIKTPEMDPNFSYHAIGAAHAGFMQIAAVPDKHEVYAAGFSGHILKFSSIDGSYLGEVSVKANSKGPDKLSGLAVLENGNVALTTVENLRETVEVNMQTGKIVHTFPEVASNRWVIAL